MSRRRRWEVLLALGAGACALPDYQGSATDGGGGSTDASSTGSSTGSGADATSGGPTTATSTSTAGAGSSAVTTTTSSQGSGAGGDGGAGTGGAPTTSAQASTGVGGGCVASVGACLGAEPNDFHDEEDLVEFWDVQQPEARIEGDRLLLRPIDSMAAVRSKQAFEAHSGPCAVWVKLHEVTTEGLCGIAFGPGDPDDDWFRIERNGSRLRAFAGGVMVSDVAFDLAEMKKLRLRIDENGDGALEFSKDGGCWYLLSGPHPIPEGDPLVRLHHGGAGQTVMDDYCR